MKPNTQFRLISICLISIFLQELLMAQVTQEPVQTSPQQQEQQTRVVTPKPLPDDLNIEDLYTYMIEKSGTYQDYRVIRLAWVNRFKIRLNDSLKYLRENIIDNQLVISNKSKQIDSLTNLIGVTNTKLSSLIKEKNSLKLFGILMNKKAYDAIMWTIIAGLLFLVGLLFLLFKRSFKVTKQTKKDLLELKDEFEDYRKKALKSKEDAVRMIYDELKKYKK